MYQRMIECRIKDGFLLFRTSFHKDAREVIVPAATGFLQHLAEILSLLLGIQIEPGILYTHKRDSHLYFHLLALFGMECKVSADVISCQLFPVAGVKFCSVRYRDPIQPPHRSWGVASSSSPKRQAAC